MSRFAAAEHRRTRRWIADNTVTNLTFPPDIRSWSWQNIQKMYSVYGKQLQEYEAVQRRIKVPTAIDIDFTDNDNIFIGRFWSEVLKLDTMIDLLDSEIDRRNQLIGVMG